MALQLYCAVIEQEPDETAWSILFPDFPEVASTAETAADIGPQAFDALLTAVEARRQDKEAIPAPTPMSEVTQDWPLPWTRQVLLLAVDVARPPARINIHMDEVLLQRVDNAAEHRGLSRSAFLAEGARQLLAGS